MRCKTSRFIGPPTWTGSPRDTGRIVESHYSTTQATGSGRTRIILCFMEWQEMADLKKILPWKPNEPTELARSETQGPGPSFDPSMSLSQAPAPSLFDTTSMILNQAAMGPTRESVRKEYGSSEWYFKHKRAQLQDLQPGIATLVIYSIIMRRMTQLQSPPASRSSFWAHFYLSFQVVLANGEGDISHRRKCSEFVEEFDAM